MSWSGLTKFLLGFTLAIALLFFTGASITRYLITRLTTPPPKPIFANDNPADIEPSPVASQSPAEPVEPSPAATPSPSPSPSPDEPGAYQARVTQPIGLVIRQDPNRDAEQIGGVEYEQELTVLSESSDGEWLRVRLSGSGVEGWVRAGNTERAE
ncbi:SH3 domain-containing protein [Oculatella sp. LEGE 06141]|uniref:SH3 domain-containing protein n=1 Tax=Oculatella sp. LEGE 06141 TaxID=1828648 RepID=UPI001881EAA1|nr:SH3 domain-containing protein [Oculatella sp. LEGE 06141]MBE9177593.1 SH3 domain-containing protein [Oculatella sp. LEGE 06141]